MTGGRDGRADPLDPVDVPHGVLGQTVDPADDGAVDGVQVTAQEPAGPQIHSADVDADR